MLVMPKSVLNTIAVSLSTMSAFLWKGSELNSKGAKAAWKEVCKPKYEGGHGLTDLECWNHSVWTNWIRSYRLKGKSIWVIKDQGTVLGTGGN